MLIVSEATSAAESDLAGVMATGVMLLSLRWGVESHPTYATVVHRSASEHLITNLCSRAHVLICRQRLGLHPDATRCRVLQLPERHHLLESWIRNGMVPTPLALVRQWSVAWWTKKTFGCGSWERGLKLLTRGTRKRIKRNDGARKILITCI